MKKIPSALKWLAEKRAHVASQVEICIESNELLGPHIEALAQELANSQALKAASGIQRLKLTAELSALDQTVRIYDENIRPELIEPIKG